MTTTIYTVTLDQLRALKREAIKSGDSDLIDDCRDSLDLSIRRDDWRDWECVANCVSAINAAAPMALYVILDRYGNPAHLKAEIDGSTANRRADRLNKATNDHRVPFSAHRFVLADR